MVAAPVRIYESSDGVFVFAGNGGWMPGAYESVSAAALAALRLPENALQALQDAANLAAGGTGGVITYAAVEAEVNR